MDAPVVATAGKNLDPPQHENPAQAAEIGRSPRHKREHEEQGEGALILHNFDRSRSWKVDRNSFDMERMKVQRKEEDAIDDVVGSECFRNKIFSQQIILSGTITEHPNDEESGSPKTMMSSRKFSQNQNEKH